MKISLTIISIIIALQATSLLFSSQQRHDYHSSISQIHQFSQFIWVHNPCPCLAEQLRYILVTIMYAASLLLFTGESVGPAFITQFVWVILQSAVLCDGGIAGIRNILVQVFILVMIGSNLRLCNGCKNEKKAKETKTVEPPVAPLKAQPLTQTKQDNKNKKDKKK